MTGQRSSTRLGSTSASLSKASAATAARSAPQADVGLPLASVAPPERTQPIIDLLGTVAVNSGAAALRRTRVAMRDENVIEAALESAGTPPPPPVASLPTLDGDGLPLQLNDATTVLLIGWLGSRKADLDKYAAMHRAAGRRVISYHPRALGMLWPERLELPATQELIGQLFDDVVQQGQSLVVHTLSNLGSFQLALLLHELQVAAARGAKYKDLTAERTRILVRAHMRAVIFDSAPAPLSTQLIVRGYVGFLRSRLRLGRRKSKHNGADEVSYDLSGWRRSLVERCVSGVLRLPWLRRHLHALHVSLRTLIPAHSHLLYLYSDADGLIPSQDILAHANSQAGVGADGVPAPFDPSCSPLPLVSALLRPSSLHPSGDLERSELSFQARTHWLQPKDKRTLAYRRNATHHAEAITSFQNLGVHSVRMHIEQQPPLSQQPFPLMPPLSFTQMVNTATPSSTASSSSSPSVPADTAAAAAAAGYSASSSTRDSSHGESSGLAEDDPAPMLHSLRTQLLRMLAAANAGFSPSSAAPPSTSSPSAPASSSSGSGTASPPSPLAASGRPCRAPIDVLHGTEPALRASQMAAQGVHVLRTVTSARFHGSPHVQHLRFYPRTYAALLEAWLANHAAPAMPQCPQQNIHALIQEQQHQAAASDGSQASTTPAVSMQQPRSVRPAKPART